MGFGPFAGYETMVTILALLLYGAVPFLAALLVMLYLPRHCWLALPIALQVLLGSGLLCWFVFSETGIEHIFLPFLQLPITMLLVGLLAIWRYRGSLQNRPRLRWALTLGVPLLLGPAATLFWYITQLAAFDWNPVTTFPHWNAASDATNIAVPVFLLLVAAILASIQPLSAIWKKALAGVGILALTACHIAAPLLVLYLILSRW